MDTISSFLFVPGDSARKQEKARDTSAHALILDLEDSVAQHRLSEARQLTRTFLMRANRTQKLFVRVNPLGSATILDDLTAVMPATPDGIMLPKCVGPGDVVRLGHMLDGMEAMSGTARGSTRIIPVATETAQAVLRMDGYAGCSDRLWGLLWGAEDLSASLGAASNMKGGKYRSPFQLARDLCLLAAAAAGVVAIDTVHTNIPDLEGLRIEAEDARADGFAAKIAIHPSQCSVINEAFHVTDSEIRWARAVLQALQDAPNGGVAVLDGHMLDRPHKLLARRILQAATCNDRTAA